MFKELAAFVKKNFLALIVVGILVLYFQSQLIEGWGTSPATLIQLASSSGYYPFWRYGYGNRYPYYRFMYNQGPFGYNNYYNTAHWPRPNHYYSYW